MPTIHLRARVTEVLKSEVSGFDWTELYTLSLEFEHPANTVRAFVDRLLSRLPDTDTSSSFSYLEGAPDWLRAVAAATARSGANADLHDADASSDETRSCLEIEFPETINRLVAGWGNAKDFDTIFQSLVLARNDQSEAWSQEAWEELDLLQGIHDRAYGAPEYRHRRLRGGRL